MTRRWTIPTILCFALLVLVTTAMAADSGSAVAQQGSLRASTTGEGSSLVQAAIETPSTTGAPGWTGLLVLLFGGVLAGLWLVAGALAILRLIGEPPRQESAEIPPLPNRGRRDDTLPDWL